MKTHILLLNLAVLGYGLTIRRQDNPRMNELGLIEVTIERAPEGERVAGQWTVLFPEDGGISQEDHFAKIGVNLQETAKEFYWWGDAYGIVTDGEDLIKKIRMDPRVEKIVESQNVYHVVPEEIEDGKAPNPRKLEDENKDWAANPEEIEGADSKKWKKDSYYGMWNMAQVASFGRRDGLDTFHGFSRDIMWDAGLGVDVYVLDTGINIHHEQFFKDPNFPYDPSKWTHGRASHFGGLSDDDRSPYVPNEPMKDENQHGTHVASIAAGGGVVGVAGWANVINVKVMTKEAKGPAGATFSIARAIEDIVVQHNKKKDSGDKNFRGSVINMSLQVGQSSDLGAAIKRAYKAGIPVVVAAGNDGKEVESYICKFRQTFCVGASTIQYNRRTRSSYGPAVRIHAPGQSILGAHHDPDNDMYVDLSGTSMAAPHVAGAIATFLSFRGAGRSSSDVDALYELVDKNRTPDIINDHKSQSGGLLHTGIYHPDRGKNPYYIPQKDELSVPENPEPEPKPEPKPAEPKEEAPADPKDAPTEPIRPGSPAGQPWKHGE